MDIEEARQLAKDETTSPKLLAELADSEDRETRRSVAANPNTSIKTLLKLGFEFQEEFLNNPILDLLILENPNFIDRNYYLQIELAKNPQTSTNFLKYLMEYGRYGIREYLAMHPNISIEMLNKMAETAIKKSISGDKTVIAIANNLKTSTYILEKLLTYWNNIKIDPVFFRDDSINCQIKLGISLASHPNTSESVLRYLITSKRKEIILSVVKNTKTSEFILKSIACRKDCTSTIAKEITKHPNFSQAVLKMLAIRGHSNIVKTYINKNYEIDN